MPQVVHIAPDVNVQHFTMTTSVNNHTVLPCVIGLLAHNRNDNASQIRIMLDSGSTVNFVLQKWVSDSRIKHKVLIESIAVEISTLYNSKIQQNVQYVELYLRIPFQNFIKIKAYSVPHIVDVPLTNIDIPRKYCTDLNMPYPHYDFPKIDMLLNVTTMFKLITGHVQQINSMLYLLPTVWGKIPLGDTASTNDFQEPFTLITQTERLAKSIEREWEIKELPFDKSSDVLTKDELQAMELIKTKMSYNAENRRFTTGLLFRETPRILNNYYSAKARLDALYQKLKKEPTHIKLYTKALQEFKEKGVIERIVDARAADSSRDTVCYLPHRGIYCPDRISTKMRPVFDASARTVTGNSLNDFILPGPKLHKNLLGIQLRFRMHKYCIVSDIKNMFHSIKINENDRDFMRFLWYDNPTDKFPTVYRWTVVSMGLTDSPYQALYALQELARIVSIEPNITYAEKLACDVIKRDMYVDDMLSGGNTEEEIIELKQALDKVMNKAHFTLRKWSSNSTKFLQTVPKEELATNSVVQLHGTHEEEGESTDITKELGYRWQPSTDLLLYDGYTKIHELNRNTKTCVARLTHKIFDPMGWAAPFILTGRIIMKQTFEAKIKWKDKLPPALIPDWEKWVDDIKNLEKVNFPRHIPNNENTTVHVFSDASIKGLGATAYTRTYDEHLGTYTTAFIMAKAKASPTKEISDKELTVPRLELNAGVIATKMAAFIEEELKFDHNKIFIYTDSIVLLYWLTKDPNQLIPYVANRIKIIKDFNYPFTHVATDINPADYCSRGLTAEQLMNPIWTNGPPFLQQHTKFWPENTVDFKSINSNMGIKKQALVNIAMPLNIRLKKRDLPKLRRLKDAPLPGEPCLLTTYSSSHQRLINVTARVLFYIEKLRTRAQLRAGSTIHKQQTRANEKEKLTRMYTTDGKLQYPPIENRHKEEAEKYWINAVQTMHFPTEMRVLLKAQHQKCPLPQESSLLTLNPYILKQEKPPIIRMKGRVADITGENRDKLIILPRKDAFTKHLIMQQHQEIGHKGVDATHYELRRNYWIIQAKLAIKSVLRKCVHCNKTNARRAQQQMATLPYARISMEKPYTYTGFDHAGPFHLKKAPYDVATDIKCYVVLFVCMSTRSVTIEVVPDHTADQLLMAILRFASIRGVPSTFYTDNHKSYKCVDGIFQRGIEYAKEKLSRTRYKIEWKYSADMASDTSGCWESLVKSMKHAFYKVAKSESLTFVEMQTTMKIIQGQLNERALGKKSDDANEVLTPNMLTHGHQLDPLVIDTELIEGMKTLRGQAHMQERFRHRQQVQKHMLNAFYKQYLPQLQQRGKWFTEKPNIKIGDLVLVEIPNHKRHQWPIRRVSDIKLGRDGKIRSVKISNGSNQQDPPRAKPHITRGIRQLYPLESTLLRDQD